MGDVPERPADDPSSSCLGRDKTPAGHPRRSASSVLLHFAPRATGAERRTWGHLLRGSRSTGAANGRNGPGSPTLVAGLSRDGSQLDWIEKSERRIGFASTAPAAALIR